MAYLADTNVMWRRFDPADPRQPEIKTALDKLLLAGESVYITAQNLIEYQSLATRPPDVNGLGLTRIQANAKAQTIESFFPFLPDTADIYLHWRSLMNTHEANGKTVHDARLVAVMLAHGVTHLLTLNPSHFQRFSDLITVVEPKDV
jgi:predicted nucleic acid-binding protein